MIFDPNDYTIVFLSYDEPNADSNYRHLQHHFPDAARIHGIKGSDLAHKECAKISKTSHVIIVDGDNYIRPAFFSQAFRLNDDIDFSRSVLSFSAHNVINGNRYGNGSVKCWPLEVLETMRTHENNDSDPATAIDFNYGKDYLQFNYVASDVCVNSSPNQAWRAGFREGVKMCLDKGIKQDTFATIDWRNYWRLYAWMHVGRDRENGLYAIHGARFGCFLTIVEDWDHKQTRDFDYLDSLYSKFAGYTEQQLLDDCYRMGVHIVAKTNDSHIRPVFDYAESFNYRMTRKSMLRSPESFCSDGHMRYDKVFVNDGSLKANINHNRLINLYNDMRYINGSNTDPNTYINAATMCESDYFYLIHSDCETDIPDHHIPFYEQPKIRKYAGYELLPRLPTANMSTIHPQ